MTLKLKPLLSLCAALGAPLLMAFSPVAVMANPPDGRQQEDSKSLGPASRLDPSCALSNDKNEMASRISPDSAYLKNVCINTARFRPVVNFKFDQEKKIVSFDNYYYQKQFWRAEVPVDQESLGAVIFHVKKFNAAKYVTAAHAQMRYKMRAGHAIQLTNQVTGEKATATDLLTSFEAALSKELPFNVALAMLPMNPLVGRVGETASILADSPRPIEQYILGLDHDEKLQVLLGTLKRSQDIGLQVFYGTIRPNCVTEQFDQIDALPRFAGKFQKFMVDASIDPVAGPSVSALQARNLIKKRVENFEDEVKGVRSILPIPADMQIFPDFIPTVDGMPWNLIMVSPSNESLSPEDQVAVAELKKDLLKYTFNTLGQRLQQEMFKPGTMKGYIAEKLWNTFNSGQSDLAKSIVKFSSQISDKEHVIAIYFAPMQGAYHQTNLAEYGINVTVPFPVITVDYDARKVGGKQQETVARDAFNKIFDGTLRAARKGMETDVPAYLLALGIEMFARRGGTTIAFQSMVGLNPVHNVMAEPGKDVNVEAFDVLKRRSAYETPVALVTTVLPVPMREDFYPKMRIDFGPLGKITNLNDDKHTKGVFRVWSPESGTPEARGLSQKEICGFRADSTPTISGKIGEALTGLRPFGLNPIDSLLKGRDINFKIFSANIDVINMAVDDMDVRVNLPFYSCLSKSDINQKFVQKGNQNIAKLKRNALGKSGLPIELIKRVIGE